MKKKINKETFIDKIYLKNFTSSVTSKLQRNLLVLLAVSSIQFVKFIGVFSSLFLEGLFPF